jgi:Bacterial sugar transferase
MTKTGISRSRVDLTRQQQEGRSPEYNLLWRQKQLLVTCQKHLRLPHLPPLANEQRLIDCLKYSPVRLVCLDARLGETTVNFWANACKQAKKPVYLRIPLTQKQLKQKNQLSCRLKRLSGWIMAMALAIALSPILLGIILLMQIYSPGLIFSRQWHVGRRGKLFQVFQFRTTAVNDQSRTTRLGRWMHQTKLDKLPHLFNAIRGEMSLTDACHLSLSDAVQLGSETQQYLQGLANKNPQNLVTECQFYPY